MLTPWDWVELASLTLLPPALPAAGERGLAELLHERLSLALARVVEPALVFLPVRGGGEDCHVPCSLR
jgi:hypothetical protein